MSIADKLLIIAENQQAVYEKGKQDEYDRFWDAVQRNGTRDDYWYAFCGRTWNAETFKPKYVIKPKAGTTGSSNIFNLFNTSNSTAFDYRTIKDKIDFSNVTNMTNAFAAARMNYIDLDLPNCTSLYACFNCGNNASYCTHLSIYITNKCTNIDYAFTANVDLTHLIFKTGSEIVANINTSPCTKLVKESITSIINALSSSTTGKTCTLSKTAVNKAFETSSDANDGSTSQEWLDLIATKSNWTISLA